MMCLSPPRSFPINCSSVGEQSRRTAGQPRICPITWDEIGGKLKCLPAAFQSTARPSSAHSSPYISPFLIMNIFHINIQAHPLCMILSRRLPFTVLRSFALPGRCIRQSRRPNAKSTALWIPTYNLGVISTHSLTIIGSVRKFSIVQINFICRLFLCP